MKMTKRTRNIFMIFCVLVLTFSITTTAFAADDPLTVVNNLSEFIFGLIAEKEGIEMDEDTYNSYISYIVSASNGQMADDNAVYEYFGSGHADEGEKYLKAQFLVTRALDSVADNAKVTFDDTSSDSTQTQEN